MEIHKSVEIEGWIGFFTKDENGYPEEFLSVKDIGKAEEIVKKLQKDIEKLKQRKER